jgi:hypothetical protein
MPALGENDPPKSATEGRAIVLSSQLGLDGVGALGEGLIAVKQLERVSAC